MAPQHMLPGASGLEENNTALADKNVAVLANEGKAARERKVQQERIHSQVINRGLKSAGIWGFGGLLGHTLLTRYNARYAKHTLPFKVFCLMMIPTAAFFTETDIAAKELDREFAQQFSITPKLPQTDVSSKNNYALSAAGAKLFFKDHQFEVIGYGWLGLIGGSLAYNFAQPRITLAQKFINARMVAQSGALLGLVAVAALNIQVDKSQPVRDLHFEAAIGGLSDQERLKMPKAPSPSNH